MEPSNIIETYWSRPADEIIDALGSSTKGISTTEAAQRLFRFGKNDLRGRRRNNIVRLFLTRFTSPLILILVFAAIIAMVVHDWLNALIVLGILVVSAVLSTVQEYCAAVSASRGDFRIRSPAADGVDLYSDHRGAVCDGVRVDKAQLLSPIRRIVGHLSDIRTHGICKSSFSKGISSGSAVSCC
jgi:hypothetical protein